MYIEALRSTLGTKGVLCKFVKQGKTNKFYFLSFKKILFIWQRER